MTEYLSKNDTRIRTFVAVALPDAERSAIAKLESRFERQRSILKVVAPDLLHITIRFLGNIDGARLPDVMAAVRQAAGETKPFSLALAGIGAFPNARSPRVIWIGLEDNAGLAELRHLASRTEQLLEEHGFAKEERSFRAHITLARVREDAPREARRDLGTIVSEMQSLRIAPGSFPVGSLIVMRSDLSRTGPRYIPMEIAHFQGRSEPRVESS
ncbi:MAG TPA: RNA 2',3'-cyclic phosphodiesterase [Chloroflexota bacterium]|nr:RNA 2',3'-cyclic phosphodiesterase [Chloroflexota bacterium]